MTRTFLFLTFALASSGCFVVDSKYLDGLADAGGGADLGMDAPAVDLGQDAGTDAGPADLGAPDLGDMGFRVTPSDSCGDPTMGNITSTTIPFPVDTTMLHNDIAATCAGHATNGNDAFFAVTVASGDYWHFHLAVDPRDLAMTRDPALYLLQDSGGSCDGRTCAQISDQCDGTGDEHFAFVAPSAGTWYLGVDDRNTGGARYVLTAIRPVCADGTRSHGEACDDNNMINGDGCDNRCRVELTDTGTGQVTEALPNDNQIEANHVLLPASNTLVVTGDIAGEDCYPDVFVVDVAAGQHLVVTALNPDGTACSATPGVPYSLELRNAANTRITGGPGPACPVLDRPAGTAGQFYVWLRATNYHDTDAAYQFRVTLS